MAEKKIQHFVPKFFLRNFASDPDRNRIDIYVINEKKYLKGCPIKHQGKRSWFYGRDLEVEDSLGDLESAAAPIISRILKEHRIPDRNSVQNWDLFRFSMILAHRTERSANKLEEMVNATFQTVRAHDKVLGRSEYDDVRIKIKEPAAFTFKTVLKEIAKAYDLKMKLLVNESREKFIISDNPAVLYNQLLEMKEHPGGHLGLLTKGLQLFVPISPECMLVYYDERAYKIGSKRQRVVLINNDEDIEQLNSLQVVNCMKVLYTDGSVHKARLDFLLQVFGAVRKGKDVTFHEIDGRYFDDEGMEHIPFISYGNNRNLRLRLSFIRYPRAVKLAKLDDRVVQLRNR